MDKQMKRNRHSRRLRAIVKIRRPRGEISDARRRLLAPRERFAQRAVPDRPEPTDALPARLRVDRSL